MWEFASVMQYIFMFGKAVKIDDDFDIEVHWPIQLTACSLWTTTTGGGADLMNEITNMMHKGLRDRVS